MNTVSVKFKKLNSDAKVPKYAKAGDAGLDLVATSKNAVSGDERYLEYGVGLAVEIPAGHVGLLFPRSSLSKYDLTMCNHVGVVDSGYRGEIKVRFKNTNGTPFYGKTYDTGDKICQLVIIPIPLVLVEETDELEDSARGNGGFGSSGK